jgi:signal transduction histidine kinase/DNA-binding response OmpR family regulator/ligand-binding sensor domain-containing protein
LVFNVTQRLIVVLISYSSRGICAFIGLVVSAAQLFAQNTQTDYIRHYLTADQGLSHNYVTSIISDEHNNKWLGTENGITIYNGYDYSYIKPSLGYDVLESENIEVLYKDSGHHIWIGTKSGGISSFDTRTGTTKRFSHLTDKIHKGDLRITSIAESGNGQIWIGTWEKGVFVIDKQSDSLLLHVAHNAPIYSISRGQNNDMWYVHGKILAHYDGQKDSIISINFKSALSDVMYDAYRNKVWVSCGRNSSLLYSFDYRQGRIDSLHTSVQSKFSKTLSIDAAHNIWIGTWGHGLYKSDSDIKSFSQVDILPQGSGRIRRNYEVILDVHHDESGQIWIGTANAGVIKMIPQTGFYNLSAQLSHDVFKGDFNITAVHRGNGFICVGTLKTGLFYGETIASLRQVEGLEDTKVHALYPYRSFIFVGTDQGLYLFDPANQAIVDEMQSLTKVTSILMDDRDSTLFIGTQQDGLVRVGFHDVRNPARYVFYNKESGNRSIASERITGITTDARDNIWISTFNGIHRYDRIHQKFLHHSKLMDVPLPSAIINDLVIDNDMLWLGTPSGLVGLQYDPEADHLSIKTTLSARNGLQNDFIAAITCDGKGALWLSTNSGIIKYDPATGSYLAYGALEGVSTTSFNNRSVFNFNNEKIYFGGVDNLTYFDPDVISTNAELPRVIFSKLRVNNQDIAELESNTYIEETIGYAREINLNSSDKFLLIGFTTNDFLGKLNVKYRYQLVGYQYEWINLQNKNEINFANLPPGIYTLLVSATRDNQTWGEPGTLLIKVKPSPWLSSWAMAVYTLLLAVFVYLFLQFKKKQLQLKTDLRIVQMDKEKEFALNEAKFNFFTNISHEFRTPLTLMMGPLHELAHYKALDENAQKKVGIIERNSNKLLNLINQLLDFRKAENGLLKLNASEGNFVRFSREVFLYFTEFAAERKIHYTFACEQEDIRFPFDRNKMEIVLCNLISNALKHCNPGDAIHLTLKEEPGSCIISIADTGAGIDSKYISKIFDRYFQIRTSNTSKMVGSGIGLAFSKKIIELHYGSISVHSEKNKGAEFVITLSTDPDQYKDVIDATFVNTDNMKAYEAGMLDDTNSSLNPESKENTILIIDDNPDILNYLNDILYEEYEVLMASGGEEGRALAFDNMPDIIVSDIMMPGIDGITLCKELKAHINTSHIPVILLTARTSTVFEIEGLKTGADDYITKPFNPLIVKARIASILDNRSKARQHYANKVRFEPTMSDANPKDDAENAFIQKAMQLVEANLHNVSFGIDHMTEELHMSQSTLYRKVKSLTGFSLSGFIRSVRLKKAAVLILSTAMNLNEVAYDVGFNDYKYFNASFKKQFNCLPSEYRGKFASVNK